MLHHLGARGAQAVMIQPDDRAFVSRPAFPTEWRARLHADALANCLWQHLLPVRVGLRGEELPTGHAHHAGFYAVTLQFLLRLDAQADFTSCADQDYVGRAFGIRKYVGSLG